MTPEAARALADRLNARWAGSGWRYVAMRSVKAHAKGGVLRPEVFGGCYVRRERAPR